MGRIKFKVTNRVDRPGLMRIIRAQAKALDKEVAIYLEEGTGRPMYPIHIEPAMPGITVTLDSDFDASCSLPPSIPESMVCRYAKHLKMVKGDVAAVRQLIRKEQRLFEKEKKAR